MMVVWTIFAACVIATAIAHERHTDNAQRGGAWHLHDPQELEPCPRHDRPCQIRTRRRPQNPLYEEFRRFDSVLSTALEASPQVVMKVSKSMISHMDKVTVSYQLRNVAATPRDWIGVYCVDNEATNADDEDYIDWRWTEGRAVDTIEFGPLTNMRCAWQFRFFSASGTASAPFTKQAETAFVRFRGGANEPQQVHLALTEAPSEMRVMWTSGFVKNATVWFGTSLDMLHSTTAAGWRTYTASELCGSPATTVAAQFFRDPGALYDAVMVDLEPSTTYFYQVGGADDERSPIYSFTMPPAAGTQTHPTSLFVFGDLGDWNIRATGPKPVNRTEATVDLMRQDYDSKRHDFIAVLHVGDLSYAMGRTYLWDQFASIVEPIASVLPYMVGIGNHEYDYLSGGENDVSGATGNGFHPPEGNYGGDSQGECGVPYAKRYVMPKNGNQAFWWSTDLALAHHVMLSSEHDFTPGSAMYQWLLQDLKLVDRTKTPWLIVHTHRPLYCSVQYPADYKVSLMLRRALEPLMAQYRVDLVFSGHYHSFERTCAVFDGVCRSQSSRDGSVVAPVHIMVGAAGANIDNAPYYDVPWRVAALMDYGYGRVHIHNATHAQFEFKRNRDRQIVDSAWIVSHHNWTVVEMGTQ